MNRETELIDWTIYERFVMTGRDHLFLEKTTPVTWSNWDYPGGADINCQYWIKGIVIAMPAEQFHYDSFYFRLQVADKVYWDAPLEAFRPYYNGKLVRLEITFTHEINLHQGDRLTMNLHRENSARDEFVGVLCLNVLKERPIV